MLGSNNFNFILISFKLGLFIAWFNLSMTIGFLNLVNEYSHSVNAKLLALFL